LKENKKFLQNCTPNYQPKLLILKKYKKVIKNMAKNNKYI